MNLLIWDAETLKTIRNASNAGKPAPALIPLYQEADEALLFEPVSVVDKDLLPPSGDKHDYMSVGPYWWPDPDKADGLPYIRRDGEVNPDRHKYDNARLGPMCSHVETLSLASFLFESELYAGQAAKLLRVWFLDPATRMNPNLEFGQAIPGICDGRGVGIIDTAGTFTRLVDALLLLEEEPWGVWGDSDRAGMRAWMKDYLTWNLESKIGKDEARAGNNHGTYYDMQAIALALFTGQPELAKQIATVVPHGRVASQVEPDGAQPHELARTNSRGYSLMNAMGFINLGVLSRHVGEDLWAFESQDGRSIARALDWFVPYIRKEKPWVWQQIHSHNPASYMPMYRMAAAHIHSRFAQFLENVPPNDKHRIHLTCPG
ncbi:MAG: alginate lyase family protein [bacterium]|nr:alginate lyase family protein [bacterium]